MNLRASWWVSCLTIVVTAACWFSSPVRLGPRLPGLPAASAQDGFGKKRPVRDRVRAPELDGGAGWINTSEPITLQSLRGKVVLLDFWTFC